MVIPSDDNAEPSVRGMERRGKCEETAKIPRKTEGKPRGVRTDVHPVPLKWDHREANNRKMQRLFDRRTKMKGYVISDGYMGYVGGSYMLFASEEEYIEYMSE